MLCSSPNSSPLSIEIHRILLLRLHLRNSIHIMLMADLRVSTSAEQSCLPPHIQPSTVRHRTRPYSAQAQASSRPHRPSFFCCGSARIWARDSSFGSGNSILRSRRPDRRSAGSSTSTRLVAASTLMRSSDAKPSSWFRSSSIVLWTSRSPLLSLSKRFVPDGV